VQHLLDSGIIFNHKYHFGSIRCWRKLLATLLSSARTSAVRNCPLNYNSVTIISQVHDLKIGMTSSVCDALASMEGLFLHPGDLPSSFSASFLRPILGLHPRSRHVGRNYFWTEEWRGRLTPSIKIHFIPNLSLEEIRSASERDGNTILPSVKLGLFLLPDGR